MSSDRLTFIPLRGDEVPEMVVSSSFETAKKGILDWNAKRFDVLPHFGPLNHLIVGTNGPDVLDTNAVGDVVLGLGGDDQLSSAFNRTALFGGRGDDALTTDFLLPVEACAKEKGVAFQFGGEGNDTLSATVGVEGATPALGTPGDRSASIRIFEDGGDGDDAITAKAFVDQLTTANVDFRNEVHGGGGNDSIDVTADATGSVGNNLVANVVDGGDGDDRITALAQTNNAGETGTATNEVTGGDGNDFIEATARAISQVNKLVSNVLDGGSGNDVLHALNELSSEGGASTSIMDLRGGEGDDVLQGTYQTSPGLTTLTLSNHLNGGTGTDGLSLDGSVKGGSAAVDNLLEGGAGDDTIASHLAMSLLGGPNPWHKPLYDVSNALKGGTGNDVLEASLSIDNAAGVVDESSAENRLIGGQGNDQLTAFAELTGPAPIPGAHPAIANYLDGGEGNDILTATIAPGTDGASFLEGGRGNDILTVFGGNGNVLNGGFGKDILIGGTGDDFMDCGPGRDTLVFAPSNGHDTAVFVSGEDLFDFKALAANNIHSFADLDIEVVGDNSIIHFDADDDITVLKNTNLSASDFLFS